MRVIPTPLIVRVPPTNPIQGSQTSAARAPSTNPTSKAAKLLAAALAPASANFATRTLGLNKYFGKILGEQHFLPGTNDVFCPFSAWECLFAAQRFSGAKIVGDVRDYLSPSPEQNRDCRNAYFRERDDTKFDIYSFGERIPGLLDEMDSNGMETLNDLYKQPTISVFSCDPCSRADIAVVMGKMKDFVRVQTDGFLRDIGGPLLFKKDVRGILMGAANLVARWEQPFDPKDTVKSIFYTDDRNKITVDMMTQKFSDGLLNADPGEGYELMFARPFATQEGPVIMLYALPQKGVPSEAQTMNRANFLKRVGDNGLDGLGLSPVIADTFSVPKFDMQQTRKVALPGAEDYLTTPTGSFDIRQTARFEHGEGLPGNFWLEQYQSPHEAIEYAYKPVGVPAQPELHVVLDRPFDAVVLLPGGLIWHALRVTHPTQSRPTDLRPRPKHPLVINADSGSASCGSGIAASWGSGKVPVDLS
jgi:hypothetical protein